MKIIINAIIAKKRAGGGFQIAKNFILKSLSYSDEEIEWYYFVSDDLDKVIRADFQKLLNINYFVFPTQPSRSYFKIKSKLRKIENSIKPDLIYSILAPSYFSFMAPEVFRFANSWVTNPTKEAISLLTTKEKVSNYLYSYIQKSLIKKRKYFITQSNVVASSLASLAKVDSKNVRVVSNVVPDFFLNLTPKTASNIGHEINIVTVAAPYKHKNTDIIPKVLKALKEQYSITNVTFHVTIPFDNSYLEILNKRLSESGFSNKVVNHGYCTQDQLVGIYQKSNICFFPSLLETFSVTILEAMYFKLPIVASNYQFNSEVAGDAAVYFKPLEAEDAAAQIVKLINNPEICKNLISNIPTKLEKYGSYNMHFQQTVHFFKEIIN